MFNTFKRIQCFVDLENGTLNADTGLDSLF